MLEYLGAAALGVLAHYGLLSLPYRTHAAVNIRDQWLTGQYLFLRDGEVYLLDVARWSSHAVLVQLPIRARAVGDKGYVYGSDGQHYSVSSFGQTVRAQPPSVGCYYQPPSECLTLKEQQAQDRQGNMLKSCLLASGVAISA
jgi:hypothetical protein